MHRPEVTLIAQKNKSQATNLLQETFTLKNEMKQEVSKKFGKVNKYIEIKQFPRKANGSMNKLKEKM